MEQWTKNIIQNAIALETLEHAFNHIHAETYTSEFWGYGSDLARKSMLDAQRIIIAAQARCRARIANHINGKVYAPDASWNLAPSDLPPHYLLIPFDKGNLLKDARYVA